MEQGGTSGFKISRLVRTASSEIYTVWQAETRVGQVHLHYAHDTIHAAVLLESDLTVAEEEELLEVIDTDIVSSYLPCFEREDLLITMFRAEEISSFSYASNEFDEFGLEDEEDED